MTNFCIGCDKNKVKGSNFLCHDCKREDNRREADSIDLQYSREFKLDLRELEQDMPALRAQR